MALRFVAALSALALLNACSASGPRNDAQPSASSGMVTPGSVENEEGICGVSAFSNIGNTTYFAFDSAVLTSEAQQYAQRQACWIALYPQHTITIEGHADERGTREYNLALGERRADALMRYFIAFGIDPKRLKTISYGKERPACTDATEKCWSQNRRAVAVVDN